MRSFSTLFASEKARKIGAAPFWILKCPFGSTGTIYLSDHIVSFANWESGITTKAWVESWGQISEDISDDASLTNVSTFDLDIIIDPKAPGADIKTILETAANNAETTDCSLYLAYHNLKDTATATDYPQLMWKGNFTDWERTSDLILHCEMTDISVRLDKYIGTKLSLTDYADAHLDDVGKMMNIIYGADNMVKCLRAAWGGVTTLKADLTAAATASLELSDASQFPSSGALWIDEEKIAYASKSGNVLSTLSRAQGGTTATVHNTGAQVHEYLSQYDSIIASHEVKTVTAIYADIDGDLLRVTSGVSHLVDSGKHIIRATEQICVAASGDVSLNDPGHDHTAPASQIRYGTGGSASDVSGKFTITGAPANMCDGSDITYVDATYSGTAQDNASLRVNFASYTGPTATAVYAIVTHDSFKSPSGPAGYGVFVGSTALDTTSTKVKQRIYIGTSVPTYITVGVVHPYQGSSYSTTSRVYEIEMEVQTNTSSTEVTDIAVTGGMIYTRFVERFHALVDGYKDDESGTITGTPSALIERPDHVVNHFLSTYISWDPTDFYSDGETEFGSTYIFSAVLNKYKKLKEWLARFAFESRCYFRFAPSRAELLLRPDALSSDKTITSRMIAIDNNNNSMIKEKRSPLSEVINKITIHYNRDAAKDGEDMYRATYDVSDAASITRYSENEKQDLFMCDFIQTDAMAQDVADFYFARYKDRKKVVTMQLFLDNAELEFADAVTIAPLSSLLCEVKKVNIKPGSAKEMRNDIITLEAKEY